MRSHLAVSLSVVDALCRRNDAGRQQCCIVAQANAFSRTELVLPMPER